MPHRRALLALGLLAIAAAGVGASSPPPPAAPVPAAGQPRTGEEIYVAACAACHASRGEGNGDIFPPLAGSEWVTGNPSRLVLVILHGLTGDVEVDGQTYSGLMPAWGGTLDDAEVAAVATYVRSAWGNRASAVTAAAVTRLRASHAARSAPWTSAELARLATPVRK